MNKAFNYKVSSRSWQVGLPCFWTEKKDSYENWTETGKKSFWKNNENLTANFRPNFIDYMV